MTWTNNQNYKLVVLKFQLLVVFYLINGRLAYKGYLSDDANEYNRELNSNFSQINSNEPPGKRSFSVWIKHFFFSINWQC